MTAKAFRLFLVVTPFPVGWSWHSYGESRGPFKRLDDAKRDASSRFGPITWLKGRSRRGVVRGEYGPAMTPEEYLNIKRDTPAPRCP